MARRFLAIPLPDALRAALAAIAPAPESGVRRVEPDGVHLTLHFLGDIDRDVIEGALADLHIAPFTLHLRGVGAFSPPTGDTVLWVGVDASASLVELHEAIGARLRAAGLKTESRSYAPHLTLARCAPRVPETVRSDWLHAQRDFGPLPWPVSAVHLYRSERVAGQAPRYVIEASWS